MSNVTPTALEAALTDGIGVDPLWGEVGYYLRNKFSNIVPIQTGVTNYQVEIVDSNEHVEGNWTTSLYVVLRVTAPDGNVQYFRKTGYYRSHDGAYWDGPLTEVSPQEKTVTVWTDADPWDALDYNSYDGESYGL